MDYLLLAGGIAAVSYWVLSSGILSKFTEEKITIKTNDDWTNDPTQRLIIANELRNWAHRAGKEDLCTLLGDNLSKFGEQHHEEE